MLTVKIISSTIMYLLVAGVAFLDIQMKANNYGSLGENIKELTDIILLRDAPCHAPITYKIGIYDERFKITKEELLQTMNEAADIWNTSTNRNLFAYSPEGNLKINLVYNTSQEVEEKLGELDMMLDAMNKESGVLRKKYNKTVGSKNKEKVQKERDALTDRYIATSKEYDAFMMKRGKESFAIGNYGKNGDKNSLDVYVFRDQKDLKYTLLHELGHALGLEHSDKKDDIMFEMNVSGNELPTDNDIAALEKRCGG